MKRFARLALAVAAATAALPPVAARAATVTVSIRSGAGNEFHPDTVTVHVGDYVSWTNTDHTLFQTDHNVTADDGSFSSKQRMKQGSSFEFQFNTPGTFTYHCTIHGWGGTVIVVSARPTRSPTPTPTPTPTRTTRPRASRSASPSPSPDATAGSTTPSIDASSASSSTSSSTGAILSIAIVSITALILLGYFVYARFLRQD